MIRPVSFPCITWSLESIPLKEVKASPGYMLDETTYYLTFTYDNETQRVILRDETSAGDDNTLTADDQDAGNESFIPGITYRNRPFPL